MRAQGLEPWTYGLKVSRQPKITETVSGCPENEFSKSDVISKRCFSFTRHLTLDSSLPDSLIEVIKAWPSLSKERREAVLSLIRGSQK